MKTRSEDQTSEDLSAVEELALAARAGVDKLRPALQRLYMTRAAAYKDAFQSFVKGYREGIAEVMASDPFKGLKESELRGEYHSQDKTAKSESSSSYTSERGKATDKEAL